MNSSYFSLILFQTSGPILLFTLIVVVCFWFIALVLHYFSFDFRGIDEAVDHAPKPDSAIFWMQMHRFLIQALFHWSVVSLAAVTTLFAFMQYYLTKDRVAFVLGLTLLFTGSIDAMQSLDLSALSYQNIDLQIWMATNSTSGVMLFIGLLVILNDKQIAMPRFSSVLFFAILFILLAVTFKHYISQALLYSSTRINANTLLKVCELFGLGIYGFILGLVYPNIVKTYPGILAKCVFYLSVTQVTTILYLMLLPMHGNSYNTTSLLKMIAYLIPLSCFIIHFIRSYQLILESRYKLLISQETLAFNASHDVLTNLYNRREFEHLLDITIANSVREYRQFAVFLIDIDNFKSINDTLGHQHGDLFLKTFSEQLVSITRKGDILSRIGGDEFTIITSTLSSPSSSKTMAERIINGLNINYSVDQQLLAGTVSVGIAIYPTDGESTEELLKHADIAMYNAKNLGKNTYQFYTKKLSAEQFHHAEIEAQLHQAIKNDEFSLHYEPQYHLISREIIGAKIQLCWNNKQLGLITPEEFIPVAERSHLMISIGHWLLNNVCEKAAYWFEKYKRHLIFSINVSSIQLENYSFSHHVKTALKTFKHPAHSLCIEIDENILMKNSEVIHQGLRDISTLGVSMSLRNVSLNHGSINHLKSLPIHRFNIDTLFVANMFNGDHSVMPIDHFINLANQLKLNLIAGGIETEAQLNDLVSRGCFIGQGIFLKKPLTAKSFEKLAY